MQIKSVLYFLVIFTDLLLSGAHNSKFSKKLKKSPYSPFSYITRLIDTKLRVKQMTVLLANPGWQNTLPATGCDCSTIVTEQNVDDTIKQVHRFLSCKYANVLNKYFVRLRAVGLQCRKMQDPCKCLDCLETFVRFIKESDPLVLRMQGALSHFYWFAPKGEYTTDTIQILVDFNIYYSNITFDRKTFINGDGSINLIDVIQETIDIELLLSDIKQYLSDFFRKSCSAHPSDEMSQSVFLESLTGQGVEKSPSPDYVVSSIKRDVNYLIKSFVASDFAYYGFSYNPISNTIGVIKNPDTRLLVDQMNKLLQYPGWLQLRDLEISETETRSAGVYDLLSVGVDGHIVSAENVDYKVLQVHQFLSCYYAKVLTTFCEHATRAVTRCESTMTLDCLNNCVQTIKESDPMVLRMQGALSYFYQLSRQEGFKKHMSQILVDFKSNYSGKKLSVSMSSRNQIEKEIRVIGEFLEQIQQRLRGFFGPFCKFLPDGIQTSLETDSPTRLTGNTANDPTQMIKSFLKSNCWGLGLTYDLKSGTTNVNPEMTQRVDQINKLLKYPRWTVLGRMTMAYDFLSADEDGQIVNYENVDYKIHQAHQILSCEYAEFLKDYCDYVNAVGPQCRLMKDTSKGLTCLQEFLRLIKISNAAVLRMQGALSYFYQLSPDIWLNKEMSEILDDFKSFYDGKTLTVEDQSIGVTHETVDIEEVMAQIVQRLHKLFAEFCRPLHQEYADKVPDVSSDDDTYALVREISEDNLEEPLKCIDQQLQQLINTFTISNYSNFGFAYDSVTNTTRVNQHRAPRTR